MSLVSDQLNSSAEFLVHKARKGCGYKYAIEAIAALKSMSNITKRKTNVP